MLKAAVACDNSLLQSAGHTASCPLLDTPSEPTFFLCNLMCLVKTGSSNDMYAVHSYSLPLCQMWLTPQRDSLHHELAELHQAEVHQAELHQAELHQAEVCQAEWLVLQLMSLLDPVQHDGHSACPAALLFCLCCSSPCPLAFVWAAALSNPA